MSRIPHYRHPYAKRTRIAKTQGKLFANQKREKKHKKTFGFMMFFIIVSALTYFLFFSKTFLIKSVTITNKNSTIDPISIEKILRKTYKKNLILIDTNGIKEQILNKHPELEEIKLKKKFPSKLKVELKTYPIGANLINTFQKQEKKFLINTNGLIVAEEKKDENLPTILIQSQKPLQIKNKAITKEKLELCLEAYKAFTTLFNMKIISIEYKPIEREIHLLTEKNFTVWIDSERDLTKQLLKLKKSLSSLNIYTESLEYIDLRIAGIESEKIIYKKRR